MNAFIKAVLQANKEIYECLHVKGLEEEDYHSFCIGAGGDRSSGIDLKAEKIFIAHLSTFGTIHSEESGIIENTDSSIDIIIDPIDGSDNLLSHLPYYGTSVAYKEKGKCTQAIIVNLANGDVFIKNEHSFLKGKLHHSQFTKVMPNAISKVGIFERSYCSQILLPKLHSLGLKYRSPGAFALSLAYAHEVSFVMYEGVMRSYDVEAGLFMCEDLYCYFKEDIFLVSKDKEIFDKISKLI